MRIVIIACVLLWASPALPTVVMSDKLQNTSAGRIVQRWLESYVGKSVVHRKLVTLSVHGSHFHAKIKQIIVPDIADYLSTGDQSNARFLAKVDKWKIGDKVPVDHIEETVELKDLDIFEPGGVGHIQYLVAERLSETLGENYYQARLLAKYRDESDETFWYSLIEIKKDADGNRQESEPVVLLLSEKEDFIKVVAH